MTTQDRRRAVLVTKSDCLLCDDAERLVRRYAVRFGVSVDVVDLAASPELQDEYGERVPVLLGVGRRVLAEGEMTAFTVQRALLKVRIGR